MAIAGPSVVLDIVLFYFLYSSGFGLYQFSICARFGPASFSFLSNKVWVFASPYKNDLGKQLFRYTLSAAVAISVSVVALDIINENTTATITLYKLIIDTGIFCAGFALQRLWVFRVSGT